MEQDIASTIYSAKIGEYSDIFVRAVNGSIVHNFCHDRLCNVGKYTCDNIDKVTDGFPHLVLETPFFSCGDFSAGKMTNMINSFNKNPTRATASGDRFRMDFGFVRGKSAVKAEKNQIITSEDNYNYYPLIANELSRHFWIFIFANKKSPITTVTSFLNTHRLKS